MKTMRTLMLLIAGVGAVGAAGCGADVPQNPSWTDDVYPILVARCVRCHNGMPQGDPLSGGVIAPGNLDHPSFADVMGLDKLVITAAPTYITGGMPGMLMPPPPAAKLADWQIQTIKNFVSANGLSSP